MIVNDDMVFLHLQKCGGTFIKHMMEDHLGATNQRPEHNGYRDIPANQQHKLIVGSIRSPYSWYTSLYFNHYQSASSFFKTTFEDTTSFSEWVKNFVTKDTGRLHDLDFSTMNNWDVGPYTFRMLNCYAATIHSQAPASTREWMLAANTHTQTPLSTSDVLLGNIEIVKTTELAKDFVDLVESNIGISSEAKHEILTAEKIHTSDHGHYSEYYDRESYDLVNHKDRLIFEFFGYDHE